MTIKQKVIIHAFAFPILWLILFLVGLMLPSFSIAKWIALGLFMGSMVRLTSGAIRYATNIHVGISSLDVTTISPFLQKSIVSHELTSIDELAFKKRNFFTRSFHQFSIYSKAQKQRYALQRDISSYLLLDANVVAQAKEISPSTKETRSLY